MPRSTRKKRQQRYRVNTGFIGDLRAKRTPSIKPAFSQRVPAPPARTARSARNGATLAKRRCLSASPPAAPAPRRGSARRGAPDSGAGLGPARSRAPAPPLRNGRRGRAPAARRLPRIAPTPRGARPVAARNRSGERSASLQLESPQAGSPGHAGRGRAAACGGVSGALLKTTPLQLPKL